MARWLLRYEMSSLLENPFSVKYTCWSILFANLDVQYLAGCGLCGGGHSTLFRRVDLFLAITGSVDTIVHSTGLPKYKNILYKYKINNINKYLCDNFTFETLFSKFKNFNLSGNPVW